MKKEKNTVVDYSDFARESEKIKTREELDDWHAKVITASLHGEIANLELSWLRKIRERVEKEIRNEKI